MHCGVDESWNDSALLICISLIVCLQDYITIDVADPSKKYMCHKEVHSFCCCILTPDHVWCLHVPIWWPSMITYYRLFVKWSSWWSIDAKITKESFQILMTPDITWLKLEKTSLYNVTTRMPASQLERWLAESNTITWNGLLLLIRVLSYCVAVNLELTLMAIPL